MASINAVREARLRRRLTQEELAKQAGVSQVAISDLESGKTISPSFALVVRLSKALGVKPESLFPVEAAK